jgi:fermentation-respiration switch protein FrsA (DUF1100 family)
MKWFLYISWLLSALFLNAQTTTERRPIKLEDIQRLLKDEGGQLSKLKREVIGNGDTNQFFYFPTHDQPATPQKWGFLYENVEFKSADGTKLHGWFLMAKGGKPKGTVVFSHGNAGSLGYHLGFVMWLAEAGYQVFMYDYRGFGKSEGTLNRDGMIQDVKAAFVYVSARKDVQKDKLISYGHSLGGAKSVAALAELHPTGLKAIVIDGAFSSYQAMAKLVAGELGAELISDEFSPKDSIAKITGTPLLVVHGQKDQVVPFAQGKQLFDLANEPKTLFDVKEGQHGDSLSRDAGAYRKKMLAWLDSVI